MVTRVLLIVMGLMSVMQSDVLAMSENPNSLEDGHRDASQETPGPVTAVETRLNIPTFRGYSENDLKYR